MTADELIERTGECGLLIDCVHGRLTAIGDWPALLRSQFESDRDWIQRELETRPSLADWPVDWRHEIHLERRILASRLLCCHDSEVRGQFSSMLADRIVDADSAMNWGQRLRQLEFELGAQSRLPAVAWEKSSQIPHDSAA